MDMRAVPPEYKVAPNATLSLPDYVGLAHAYALKTDVLDATLPLIEPTYIHKRAVTEWTLHVHDPSMPSVLSDPAHYPGWEAIAKLWLRRKFVSARGFAGDVQADLLLASVYPFLSRNSDPFIPGSH